MFFCDVDLASFTVLDGCVPGQIGAEHFETQRMGGFFKVWSASSWFLAGENGKLYGGIGPLGAQLQIEHLQDSVYRVKLRPS